MAMMFWAREGILLMDYMPHKTTVTGDVYAVVLWDLRESE
jgi:hypothetical protein